MTREEFDKLLEELEYFEKELIETSKAVGENYEKDGSHVIVDSGYENIQPIRDVISRLKKRISEAQIVENIKEKEDTVGYGDKLEVTINSHGNIESFEIKLVRQRTNQCDEGCFSVSSESIMGQAIHGTKLGEKVAYQVDDDIFEVTINSINGKCAKILNYKVK